MNNKFILLILILCTIMFQFSITAFSFKKIYSFFIPEHHETLVHKEYTINSKGTLEIENFNGNIQIKTAWNQNTIFLKAIKKSPTEEQLQSMHIIDNIIDKNTIQIKTHEQDKNNGSIDLFLIVPTDISVHLHTKNGMIKIRTFNGNITAQTQNGDIELYQTTNTVNASTENGSIIISYALGNIHATTKNGNIEISQCSKSVIAHAPNGRITVKCKEVPPTSKIQLTAYGNIHVHIPHNTNAEIQAYTKNGTATTEQPITLKPQTLTLNSHAWSQFKHSINGTLGTGEAIIKINSSNGHIKILDDILKKT